MRIFSCIYLIIYEIFQIYFAFRSICTTFAPGKHCHGLSLVSLWHERKVRAAQGTPLLKVEDWGLQVHVYHRLRVARPSHTMEGRTLEPWGDLWIR